MKKKYITPYIDYIAVEQEDSCLISLSAVNGNQSTVTAAGDDPDNKTSPDAGNTTPGTSQDPTEGFGDAKGGGWFDDSQSGW